MFLFWVVIYYYFKKIHFMEHPMDADLLLKKVVTNVYDL